MSKFKCIDIETGDYFITSDSYAKQGNVGGVVGADVSTLINSKRGEYKIGRAGTRKRIIVDAFKEEFNKSSVNLEEAKENTIKRFKIESL